MAPRTVEVGERRARLARRHRLIPAQRTDSVATIADDLVALHSSDPVSVYLSAAARMRSPSIVAVEAALYDDRAVVRHHAMRRTLWVMTPEVARAAHASSTVKIAEQERRRLVKMLEEHDVRDADDWLRGARRLILDAVAEIGPATARQIGEHVPELKVALRLAEGKSYASTQQAHTRVLLVLGFEGAVVRARPTGSWINGQYRWAAMEQWLPGGVAGAEPAVAAAALADRWLRAFGPASVADVQWWTGWTMTAAKQAIADAGAVEVDVDGGTAWVAGDDTDPEQDVEPWVALLPALDPTTMGWKQRDWYLDPALGPRLFDRNGNAGPTVWADGRVVGGWVQRADGEIAVRLLADVGHEHAAAIERAADDLRRLVGDARFTVRFPAPLQAELR